MLPLLPLPFPPTLPFQALPPGGAKDKHQLLCRPPTSFQGHAPLLSALPGSTHSWLPPFLT